MANESEIIQFLKMTNNELNTEGKIFRAACGIFLLYGYHGTKLRQIASLAGVQTSLIHYYFRSKERLYELVVKLTLDLVLNTDCDSSPGKEILENPTRFFCIELYNNQSLFEQTLKHLYMDDWVIKFDDLKNKLEFHGLSGITDFNSF